MSAANVRDKADLLRELRDVQKQLLEKAKERSGSKNLRKADTTHEKMSSKKFQKSKDKKEKKKKKKHKKEKKKKHSSTSSNSEDDDNDTDLKSKSVNKNDADSNSDADEWIEKKPEAETKKPLAREDWLKDPFLIPTYSKNVEKKDKNKNQDYEAYDPAKSSRELNPHWKDGGSGIPAFKKPSEDIYESRSIRDSLYKESRNSYSKGNWRKSKEQSSGHQKEDKNPPCTSTATSENPVKQTSTKDTSNFLTDQQMNEIGAKLIKAEILGNTELVKELQEKLERARETRNQRKDTSTPEDGEDANQHILLTTTDSRGVTRPLSSRSSDSRDSHNNRGKRGKKHVETHEDGKRTKYFPDDDRYDIKQMFEREKHLTASDGDAEFAEIAGKQRNKKDDLEDIFADEISKSNSEDKKDIKDKNRAIRDHERYEKMLETCEKCFDSKKMDKDLLVSVGSSVYLSLPWHEGVQPGHCLIVPIHHVSCSTQLDEDVWSEITDIRKALTRMFAERSQDVIFFEIARYLNRRPHMEIHCIPSKNFEMAPFYFKKAIQESEYMWSTNKQLISLKDTNLRRAIPKGLPYFWVHFGMDSGFAHVIEDQEKFPSNFAQEIIGGMLELDPRVWRRPRKEHNSASKVKIFADGWKPFDCTK